MRRRPFAALTRRAFLDARVRTIVFAYLFAVYAYVQPFGYRRAYPTDADRIAFARSFANNIGLRLFYGEPHDVATVDGYTAWRVGGTLAIAAAAYGLLAAVRAQRAEEDSGRAEIVLSGVVSRRTAGVAVVAAIGLGAAVLWLAEVIGFAVAGLPLGGAAYLALATASVIPVCAAAGAIAGQLAPTRRVALEVGGAVVGLFFVLRILADTVSGLGWLRWATPLGWAEELRPFAGPRPVVLLLPLLTTIVLAWLASRLASGRDIGTGVLPARDARDPDRRLLSSPALQAIRTARGTLLAWSGSVAFFSFILGIVANSISTADLSESVQKRIARLGAGSLVTPKGYLGFVFIFIVLGLSLFVCAQVGGARDQEDEQQLETLLALPLSRERWLFGRLAVAAGAAVAIALTAGVAAWVGVRSGGSQISLARLLEAGANALPTAIFFLGVAGLVYAAAPRATSAASYGLVAVAFLWQLVGALVGAPRWLREATPFAHVGLVPAQSFRPIAAVVLVAIGLLAAVVSARVLARRDLAGA